MSSRKSRIVCLCDLLYELCASERHNSFRFEQVMTYLEAQKKNWRRFKTKIWDRDINGMTIEKVE